MNNIKRIKYKNRIEYTLNGKLHRTDGPALIWNSGAMLWYLHGWLHRDDGPALIDSGGIMICYIGGEIVKSF